MIHSHKPKKLMVAGGVFFAALALPMAAGYLTGTDYSLIATAQAAESGSGGHAGSGSGQAQKGKPGGAGGAMGSSGGAMGMKVFRAPVTTEEEDSDRPAWAGVKGGKAGGGGKPAGAGTKKGDLFGDMVVLLRDTNGEPVLDSEGRLLVIAYVYDSNMNLVPLTDASGNLLTIPYNADGDLATQVTLADGSVVDVYAKEVDLGRLSVGRSPTKVLQHSLDEALAKLTAPDAVITLDASGRLVVNGVTIDSPLENLALYDAYMSGTLTVSLPAGFNPASLLAAAADKTGTITIDTVVYMNSILGLNTPTYYNFDTYNYDRYTTWKDATATVLVYDAVNNVYVPTVVNLYETVFNSTNWVDPTPVSGDAGADDFAAAANDYLQVIEFLHDNEVR